MGFILQKGVTGDKQMNSDMNACQEVYGETSVSISVELPAACHDMTEDEIATFLENNFAVLSADGFDFNIMVGPDEG